MARVALEERDAEACSNFRIAWLTALGVRFSTKAAARKDPVRPAASKTGEGEGHMLKHGNY